MYMCMWLTISVWPVLLSVLSLHGNCVGNGEGRERSGQKEKEEGEKWGAKA